MSRYPENATVLRMHPQQARALQTPATEVLYGGAAGGGKSHLMRVSLIRWCVGIPGLQGFLFRRIYGDLVQNHIEGPTGFPVLLGKLIQQGKAAIVREEIRFANGSKIYLRHCQHEKDVTRYQGAEIHFLAIDEATHWTEKMYRFLRGRCRLGGLNIDPAFKPLFPRVLASANPGGLGHHWVKKTWVDHGPMDIHRAPAKEGGMLRQYIPARIQDNPSLLRNDPDYVNRLEGLGDEVLVRAMKEGDWDVVAGAMFGGVWSRARHVCQPFPIPESWEIWRGADDGFAAPASAHWFTENPDTGTIYVIAEVYKAGMQPHEYAERVLAMDKGVRLVDPYGRTYANREPLWGLMDSAAFTNPAVGQRIPSRAEQMNALGCRWKPVEKGPNSRVQRAQNMHRVLAPNPRDPRGGPGLIFFSTCVDAIRTIPALGRDPHNIEDVNSEEEDHAYDSVTYGLQRKAKQRAIAKVRGF